MELKIAHLYPDVLNLYGDGGNIMCLRKRLVWRGLGASVSRLPLGSKESLSGFDIVFIGGGQDFEQQVLLEDLHRGRADEIRAAANDGVVFLTICGGYQMMGHYYETFDGQRCDFIGLLDLSAGGSVVVGFENHSGRTMLAPGLEPLGTVLSGFGNNGEDKTEGAHWKNVFGTYSHGPMLPKNPAFCDMLLSTALARKYGRAGLEPLDDAAETAAHDEMCGRI